MLVDFRKSSEYKSTRTRTALLNSIYPLGTVRFLRLGSCKSGLRRSKFLAQAIDGDLVGFLGARVFEDGAAGHHHVHTGLCHLLDVGSRHPTVNLQADV